MQSPSKYQYRFFKELEQIILNFVGNYKKSQVAETISRKKNKVGNIMFPDFKLYYKDLLINTVQYWHQNIYIYKNIYIYIYQWNTI